MLDSNRLKWFSIVIVVCFLSGCANTSQPTYPSDLQMIIAQSNQTIQSAPSQQGQSPVNAQESQQGQSPVSVAQLMASIRANHKAPAQPPKKSSWIFESENDDRSAEPELQKMQLRYQSGAMMPNQMQLALAKQLASKQDMQLVELSIGGCSAQKSLACVATAQKRARQLVEMLTGETGVKPAIEYKPQLGKDVAVVTFAPLAIKTATFERRGS